MITKSQLKGTYDDLTKRYVIKYEPLVGGPSYYLLGFQPGTAFPKFTIHLHQAMVYEYSSMTDEYVGLCKDRELVSEAVSMNKKGNYRSGLKGDVYALKTCLRLYARDIRLVTLKKRVED